MFNLLRDGPRLLESSLPRDGAPVRLASSVHEGKMIDDGRVAQNREHYHEEQTRRVDDIEHFVLCRRRVRLNEAPRSGTVLNKLPKSEERCAAEKSAQQVYERDGDVPAAFTHALLVTVRMSDGEPALHCHEEENGESDQTEKSHGESKVSANQTVFTHPEQRFISQVRG